MGPKGGAKRPNPANVTMILPAASRKWQMSRMRRVSRDALSAG
jgi:hypothetical protein